MAKLPSRRPPVRETLASLDEDRLIARLTAKLPSRANVRVGVGDDCAVIGGARDRHWQLLKTDAVVEGVHFSPGEDFRRVGWKALCRNISDIAAMGGTPENALITIAVSPETEVLAVERLYDGIRRAAERFGVGIVGGETSRSPGPLFLSISLTGSVERKRCILRSGGQPGDAIFVTGRLGGSFASGKHLDFQPRVPEARWLTELFHLHAMMDLSDGLGSDLPRLARASHCGAEIWPAKVPRNRGCTVEQALGDGEDFELLFTVAADDAAPLLAAWKAAFPRLPLTQVGRLTTVSTDSNPEFLIGSRGFDHFAQSR